MGDMADFTIEQGYDEWVLHQIGDCVEDCIYCKEEDNEIWYTEIKDET